MLENTAYIGLSRQLALQRQMDMVANNIANMNTTGFKSQKMMFAEYLLKQDTSGEISLVQDLAVLRKTSAGTMQTTANSLDLAIKDELVKM